MKHFIWIIFIVLGIGIFSSCLKNEICSPVDIELKVGIYSVTEVDSVMDTLATTIDIDTLSAIGMDNEYLLLGANSQSKISFPLDNSNNQSQFVITHGNQKDTLSFTYDKHLLFNTVKCGVAYTYSIQSIQFSTHFIKDIRLLNSEINAQSTENIRLVY